MNNFETHIFINKDSVCPEFVLEYGEKFLIVKLLDISTEKFQKAEWVFPEELKGKHLYGDRIICEDLNKHGCQSFDHLNTFATERFSNYIIRDFELMNYIKQNESQIMAQFDEFQRIEHLSRKRLLPTSEIQFLDYKAKLELQLQNGEISEADFSKKVDESLESMSAVNLCGLYPYVMIENYIKDQTGIHLFGIETAIIDNFYLKNLKVESLWEAFQKNETYEPCYSIDYKSRLIPDPEYTSRISKKPEQTYRFIDVKTDEVTIVAEYEKYVLCAKIIECADNRKVIAEWQSPKELKGKLMIADYFFKLRCISGKKNDDNYQDLIDNVVEKALAEEMVFDIQWLEFVKQNQLFLIEKYKEVLNHLLTLPRYTGALSEEQFREIRAGLRQQKKASEISKEEYDYQIKQLTKLRRKYRNALNYTDSHLNKSIYFKFGSLVTDEKLAIIANHVKRSILPELLFESYVKNEY